MADEMVDCTLPENEMHEMCMESEEDHHDEGGHGNPMMAQVKFLTTAMFAGVGAALNAFRYKAGDNYYTDYSSYMDTDYFKLADQLRDYSRTAIWGTLFILQALSMGGIAVEVNMMAWHYLGMVWMLTSTIEMIVMFLAYEAFWTKYEEDSTTYAMGITYWMKAGSNMKAWLAVDTMIYMGLMFSKDKWAKAQFMMLPEERQAELREEKNIDDDGDYADAMFSEFFGF